MPENVLTFSDLRRIEKEEKRKDELSERNDNFILRVSNYLQKKHETGGDSREYRNSKRVFDKIMSLREEKIVKNARLSVRSDVKGSELNLLPCEQETYRELKKVFEDHQERVERDLENEIDKTNPDETGEFEPEMTSGEVSEEDGEEGEDQEKDTERSGEPDEEEKEEQEEKVEEGYTKVKAVQEIPEFMGTDLETYGPFDEGEEVVVPEDNAEILVNRGNAEEV
ncbi:MAG: hypothetical protein ABEK01_03095 [Candidatus Nanohaloarchaea archaeon]